MHIEVSLPLRVNKELTQQEAGDADDDASSDAHCRRQVEGQGRLKITRHINNK